MKTTNLITAVLFALSISAHAELRDSGDDKVAPPAAAAPAPMASKDKPDEKKQDAKSDAKTADKHITKIVKDSSGKMIGTAEIGIVGEPDSDGDDAMVKFNPVCDTGRCEMVVFATRSKNLNDLDAIVATVLKKNEKPAAKKDEDHPTRADERKTAKEERESKKELQQSIRDELESNLASECNIDESTFDKKHPRSEESGVTLTQYGINQAAGLNLPQRSQDSQPGDAYRTDAECSVAVLEEFMTDHSSDNDENQDRLDDLKAKLDDLKKVDLPDLQDKLRDQDTEAGKKAVRAEIKAKEAEIRSVTKEISALNKKITNFADATAAVAKDLVINPAVSDMALHGTFGPQDKYLYSMAVTAPKEFKAVQLAAAQGLANVYKIQTQQAQQFKQLANQAQNTTQKTAFLQKATFFQNAANNYNSMMMNVVSMPGTTNVIDGYLQRQLSQLALANDLTNVMVNQNITDVNQEYRTDLQDSLNQNGNGGADSANARGSARVGQGVRYSPQYSRLTPVQIQNLQQQQPASSNLLNNQGAINTMGAPIQNTQGTIGMTQGTPLMSPTQATITTGRGSRTSQ
jgi:hypothetical protein